MPKGPEHAQPNNGSVQLSHSEKRSIFRTQALRHYRQSQDRVEFPRFATPRALAYLWILAALFIIVGTGFGYRFFLPIG